MRPIPEVPGVDHRFVRAGDVTLHVAEAGPADAPAVVLLHGWPQHWYLWRHVMGPLAERFRVVAPDLRGFGWSDAPRGDYRKERLAADVVALLDALELDTVRLAGHDWGGLVGFLVALRVPARVDRFLALSIVHPWVQIPLELKSLRRASYQLILAAPVTGGLVQRHTPFVDQAFRLSGGDRIWTPEERESFTAQFREPDRAAAATAMYRTFLRRERSELGGERYASRRLTVPTRLVVGRADPVIRPRLLAGWETHADDMAVEYVDGGHFLPDERPELVVERALELF